MFRRRWQRNGDLPAGVVVYTTPGCGACAAVKGFLTAQGVPFEERNVADDPAYLEEMKRLAGVRIAPVTVIGDEAFYGTFEAQLPHVREALAKRQS